MEKICFTINSQKRGIAKLRHRVEALFSGEYELSFLLTNGHRSAEKLARISAEEGASVIVAVGGDGTVNEVINGVIMAGAKGLNTRVAVLPWGTGNDFARSIGVGSSLQQLYDSIKERRYGCIDVVEATFTDSSGRSAVRYFNNVGDVGLGPDTVITVNRISRWFGAKLSFSIAAVKALFFLKPKPVAVTSDSVSYTGKVRCVCLANGTYFGSGLGIAPYARLNNGKISLVIIEDVTAFDFIRLVHFVRRAEPVIHPKVRYVEVEQVHIDARAGELPIELDGEIVGFAPLKARAVPKRITIYGSIFTPSELTACLEEKNGANRICSLPR